MQRREDIKPTEVASTSKYLNAVKRITLEYNLSIRHASVRQAVQGTHAFSFLAKACNSAGSVVENEIVELVKELIKHNLGQMILALVTVADTTQTPKKLVYSQVVSSHYDAYATMEVVPTAGYKTEGRLGSGPVQTVKFAKGEEETPETKVLHGIPMAEKCIGKLEIDPIDPVMMLGSEMVVTNFRTDQGVVKKFDETTGRQLRPDYRNVKYDDFQFSVGNQWSPIWSMGYDLGEKNPIPKKTHGSTLTQFWVNYAPSNVGPVILESYRKCFPGNSRYVKFNCYYRKILHEVQVLKGFYDVGFPQQFPYKSAIDFKNNRISVHDARCEDLFHYINLSRNFRGKDNKGLSGITAGYFYGLKYMPQAMIDAANWANLVFHLDISPYNRVVIVSESPSSVQGILFALKMLDSKALIHTVGISANSSDFSYCNVKVEQCTLEVLLRRGVETVAVDAPKGKKGKPATVMYRVDESKAHFLQPTTLIIDTLMESVYPHDLSKAPDVASKLLSFAHDLNAYRVNGFHRVKLIPLMPKLDSAEKVGFSFGMTAEPHTGYIAAYYLVKQKPETPPYWAARPIGKLFREAYATSVLVNLMRNATAVIFDYNILLRVNELPTFVYLTMFPVRVGHQKVSKAYSQIVTFDAVFGEDIGAIESMKLLNDQLKLAKEMIIEEEEDDNDSDDKSSEVVPGDGSNVGHGAGDDGTELDPFAQPLPTWGKPPGDTDG